MARESISAVLLTVVAQAVLRDQRKQSRAEGRSQDFELEDLGLSQSTISIQSLNFWEVFFLICKMDIIELIR